ncbi:hypothetical protein BDEG_23971 [Batrachochytrium dendrobatidis JEL423]|uniref:Uncharacterized protein n=1 Tax=Batrachochytrium dendrobatidis (strain JEL423) TaxID=403673 RepID=A0A177WJA7_BATDL|nr:hypothetical protein BDEG_23971 [Batrachochytrium dendrobatidis JEL423]
MTQRVQSIHFQRVLHHDNLSNMRKFTFKRIDVYGCIHVKRRRIAMPKYNSQPHKIIRVKLLDNTDLLNHLWVLTERMRMGRESQKLSFRPHDYRLHTYWIYG